MSRRAWACAAGAVGLAFGAWFWLATPRQMPVMARPSPESGSNLAARAQGQSPIRTAAPEEPVTAETTPAAAPSDPTPDESSPPRRKPGIAAAEPAPSGPEPAPGIKPAVLLGNMRIVFRNYQSRFGGNPVGNNREITRALNGSNPGQVVFLNPEDGAQINARGELVDNWGTPLFFHQLSGTVMEIRSAGPDRRMWTADDLVVK